MLYGERVVDAPGHRADAGGRIHAVEDLNAVVPRAGAVRREQLLAHVRRWRRDLDRTGRARRRAKANPDRDRRCDVQAIDDDAQVRRGKRVFDLERMRGRASGLERAREGFGVQDGTRRPRACTRWPRRAGQPSPSSIPAVPSCANSCVTSFRREALARLSSSV